MSDRRARTTSAPELHERFFRWSTFLFNPAAKFLLAIGVPMGPNGLITIRGRKSGLLRTTPVAIIEVSDRRWVWSPYGEHNWVRNLRAAGRATVTVRRHKEDVTAIELDPGQRVGFFRDIYGPLVREIPLGLFFVRVADGVDLTHPVEAAGGRAVFELHPMAEEPPMSNTDTLVTLNRSIVGQVEKANTAIPHRSWFSQSSTSSPSTV